MITLYKNHRYDNQYNYIKGFASESERTTFFNGLQQISYDDVNYIKDHETIIIDMNYEDLLLSGYNYLSFRNENKTIYAFIVRKEYINSNATRLHYEIDVFTTFHFNFEIKKSFIERKLCKLEEITDFDEGLYLGNHTIRNDTMALTKKSKYFALFSGIKDYELVMDENGKLIDYVDVPTTQNKPMTTIDGIQYPLYFVLLADGKVPQNLADHPSLVSIIRMPDCTFTTDIITIPYIVKEYDYFEGETPVFKGYATYSLGVTVAKEITSIQQNSDSIGIPKEETTDFYPYTYYVLTDGETEPLIMHPQDIDGEIKVVSRHALSHQPIERYYVSTYRGDLTGRTYNITNANQMVIPTATNQGLAQLSANGSMMSLQRKGMVTDNILGGVSSVIGSVASVVGGMALAPATGGLSLGATMNGVSGLTNTASGIAKGIQAVKEADRRSLDMALTPSSISSLGTPSTRLAFGNGYVRVLQFTVSDKVKTKVKNFQLRYGHKFNNYDTISHKTYRGYIKFIEPDIDGSIDNMFLNKINDVLERGVYID